MGEYLIFTGTVTYAIKGRDVLRKKGFNAYVKKVSGAQSNLGCGYAIVVNGDIKNAEKILSENKIKILKINKN